MTASSWKWVLPRPADELIRVLCSYVPTAPLTVQHSNCSCKSNYILMKFVYFLRSFLHDGFLFLKKKTKKNPRLFGSYLYIFKMLFIYVFIKEIKMSHLFCVEAFLVLHPPYSVFYRMSIRNFLIPEFT